MESFSTGASCSQSPSSSLCSQEEKGRQKESVSESLKKKLVGNSGRREDRENEEVLEEVKEAARSYQTSLGDGEVDAR